MQCYRVSDGATVPDSEAFGPNGIRDGYSFRVPATMRDGNQISPGEYVGFSLAFMDAARASGPVAAFSLSSGDREAVIARAQMIHHTNNAYLGDRAPAFTDVMAQLAVRKAENDLAQRHVADAASVVAGNHQRAEADAARAQMIDGIRNAWRK